MKVQFIAACAASVVLTGCWTIRETEYPTVSVPAVPAGKTVKVRFSRNWAKLYLYDARTVPYRPVPGHEKISPGNLSDKEALAKSHGANTTYAWGMAKTPQLKILGRLTAELMAKGYTVTEKDAQYVIGFKLAQKAPLHGAFAQFGMSLSHLWFAGWNDATWEATVTVYDSTEKTELFTKTYEQTYETKVWGLCPIMSPACHEMMEERAAKCWVWTALADRALEDAATFIVGRL